MALEWSYSGRIDSNSEYFYLDSMYAWRVTNPWDTAMELLINGESFIIQAYGVTYLDSWTGNSVRLETYYSTLNLESAPRNSSPSVPGEITYNGSLITNTTITLNCGPSSDAEGDSLQYRWQVSKNMNTYIDIGTTSTNSIQYTIPNDATSLSFRVQAYDGFSYSGWKSTQSTWAVSDNTAPTTPGAFTQPTGELEIGDSKVISWGVSQDREGNFSNYILEAQINNGAWTVIGNPSSSNYTYKIPTATSIKFRVRAKDKLGLESAYRESSVFTVTKPKYYWSKYNVNKKDSVTWTADGYTEEAVNFQGYTGYAFTTAGKGVLTGVYESYSKGSSAGNIPLGHTLYDLYGDRIRKRVFEGIVSGGYIQASFYLSNLSWVDVRGTLVQSGIIAEEGTYPMDGVQSGYWWIRGSRVNQSIAPPGPFTEPAAGTVFKPSETANIVFGATTAPNLSLYEVDYRYNENAWTPMAYNNTLSRQLGITTDKSLTKLQFRVRAKNTSGVYSDWIYSEIYEIQHNSIPTLVLNTTNNRTLYENDILSIDGNATDVDVNNVVFVKYQINGGNIYPITSQISTGAAIPFSKSLTFKQNKLYDGETAVTDTLIEGTQNILKVWAEDDQGGKSIEHARNFFVVPNRPATITINPIPTRDDLIDSDSISVTGTVNDPDNNSVVVKYKVNNGAYTEVYNGNSGDFSFTVLLEKLNVGDNTLTIQAVDSYGAITTKALSVNKSGNVQPLLESVTRYKITPPNGTASGIILWIQREVGDLEVSARVSMTLNGEEENFQDMTKTSTAYVSESIEEDEFVFSLEDLKKESIVIEITQKRTSVTSNKGITLISGVLS